MADIDALIAALSLDEKAALLAGADLWSTVAVDRLGLPSIRVTDGPSGARGATFPGADGRPSTCIPCGSAMGATWNPDLAEEIGALAGREAVERGCRALLAPTINLHRAVLAGRNFECYSEDPLLSGRLAAGFVRGVQSNGVIATVKHFVGNDQETERTAVSSVIDDRSLRELYLLPFELAVREGGALGVMTAYNRLNGSWLTTQPGLLLDVLRGEWGFAGLVMTDWFAVADTVESASAGLDLEMPGPGRVFGKALAVAVDAGEVDVTHVDAALRRQLAAWNRVGALDADTPEQDHRPQPATAVELVRRAAVESIVLLRNDGVLPFEPSVRRVAVIGPNADAPRIMGGGSSEVTPYRNRSPLEELRDALGSGVEIVHERGCDVDLLSRVVGGPGLRAVDGFELEISAGGTPISRRRVELLRILGFEAPAPGPWTFVARGSVVAAETGTYELTLAQSGRARVAVDGSVVLDGVATPPPPGGTDLFGFISQDLVAEVELEAGVAVAVEVTFDATEPALWGARVGFRPPRHDDLLGRATRAAASADVAVVVVGTSAQWETEGRDRTSFSLPGEQDDLVRAVATANPRTAVVVNAGAAVDLPWAEDVGAVLQCWFGGQEMSAAVAAVLTGAEEPGGRLATTIPFRLEHSPSYDNFPGENGEVRYGEGLFMGYRGYEHRAVEPRFPFGHGLGYTTFELGVPVLSAPVAPAGATVTVSIPVTNTGGRRGTEVVQCYVAPQSPRLVRPAKELKAFAKITLDAGESTVVDLVLDHRAFAYWDPGQSDWEAIRPKVEQAAIVDPAPPAERRSPGWQVDAGHYDVCIGRSSGDIAHRVTVELTGDGSRG